MKSKEEKAKDGSYPFCQELPVSQSYAQILPRLQESRKGIFSLGHLGFLALLPGPLKSKLSRWIPLATWMFKLTLFSLISPCKLTWKGYKAIENLMY